MPIFPHYENPEEAIKGLMPQGGDQAESALYRLLQQQLPENWYAVHNVHFRGDDGHGQVDFLIIANGTKQYPDAKGIVNLECKGLSYQIASNGSLFLNGKACDPIGQSKGAIKNLYESLRNDVFNGKHFGIYAHAVVFPTRSISDKERQDLKNLKDWIFDEKDCENICGIVNSALAQTRKALNHPQPTELTLPNAKIVYNRYSRSVLLAGSDPKETLDKFRELGVLMNNAQLIHDANLEMQGALTYAQNHILSEVFESEKKFFHITGGAGTGKTFIGLAAAEKLLSTNPDKHVLYVCYNSSLAAFHNIKKIQKNLEITSFFRLPYLCFTKSAAKEIFKSDMGCEDNDWKTNIVPNIQKKWTSGEERGIIPQFDMIIVDEAQDFNPAMVNFVACLKKPDAKIIFLSDKVQNIYEDESCIEKIPAENLSVRFNLRNTNPIDAFSCTPLELHATSTVKGPDVSEISGNYEALQNCIKDLIPQFLFSQIAILTDSQDVLEHLQDIDNVCKFCSPGSNFQNTIGHLKDWQQDKKILKSTVHAFKGLEAECVVYIKTNKVAQNQKKIDYIGSTRAKVMLIVFSLGSVPNIGS